MAADRPGDEQARYSLARALVKSGKFAEALESFQKVAAAAPRDTNFRDDFGELLLRHGEPLKPSSNLMPCWPSILRGRLRSTTAHGLRPTASALTNSRARSDIRESCFTGSMLQTRQSAAMFF
jgi:hypothetical protein